MIKKILVISQILSEGPTPQIQRVFWKEMAEKYKLELYIICEPGDYKADFPCRLEVVKKRKWVKLFLKVLSGLGMPDLSHIPDMGIYDWLPLAYKRGLKLCEDYKIDCIYSISWPQSNHWLAYKLKKVTDLPWVACFYDPWVEHILQKYNTNFFKRIDARRERLVAENADLIIHSNQTICSNWSARYGNSMTDKMRVLPFCFKLSELPEISPHIKGEKLRIMHIGGVYGSRSSTVLVEAVRNIMKFHPSMANQIEIVYVGHTYERVTIENNTDVCHLFKFMGNMPMEQLYTFYESADVFLLLDMNMPRCPFFPSKLMMYEYYRKPIIGITNRDSVLEQELKDSGYPVFYYGDSRGLADYILMALLSYNSLFVFNQNTWKIYDVRSVAEVFYTLLKKLS